MLLVQAGEDVMAHASEAAKASKLTAELLFFACENTFQPPHPQALRLAVLADTIEQVSRCCSANMLTEYLYELLQSRMKRAIDGWPRHDGLVVTEYSKQLRELSRVMSTVESILQYERRQRRDTSVWTHSWE